MGIHRNKMRRFSSCLLRSNPRSTSLSSSSFCYRAPSARFFAYKTEEEVRSEEEKKIDDFVNSIPSWKGEAYIKQLAEVRDLLESKQSLEDVAERMHGSLQDALKLKWAFELSQALADQKPEDEVSEKAVKEGFAQALKEQVLEKIVAERMKWLDQEEMFELNTDVEELFKEEFWDNLDEEEFDTHDYLWKLKVDRLCNDLLNIPAEEQPKFRKEVDISQGYTTLEWVLPSPPPLHTFEELPIVKKKPDGYVASFS